MTLPIRQLSANGPEIPALGLGCMGMSEFYGERDDTQSLHVLHKAHELGIRMFDTADMYGNGHNEELLSQFLKTKPRDVLVATKFGIRRKGVGVYERTIDNSPDYIREACDASLKRLGIDCIDLYYAHRINPAYPIEETVGALTRLIEAGKIRRIGLSEVSPATLKRAHAVHPIAALQSEYSLWTRDVEAEILPLCRELGIAFVAYSPLGRGFLSGAITSTAELPENDFRRTNPRFADGNLERNLPLLDEIKKVAKTHNATPAQVALAWVLAQGSNIFAIPGTKRLKYLMENIEAAKLALSSEEIERLSRAIPPGVAQGERYTEAGRVGLNS